ncbi:hypothetical protein FKM82_001104 [Ascaphus truei]
MERNIIGSQRKHMGYLENIEKTIWTFIYTLKKCIHGILSFLLEKMQASFQIWRDKGIRTMGQLVDVNNGRLLTFHELKNNFR